MKTRVLVLLVGVVTLMSINSYAAESLTVEKRADTRKLFEVTGALKIGQVMSEAIVKQMSEVLKQSRPDIPSRMFDVLEDEVNKVIAEEMNANSGLVDLMIVLYHKYWTHDDIKGLIAFYQTSLGKKAISLMPVITQEGFLLGQRWGESLGPKIGQRAKARFKQEGYEL